MALKDFSDRLNELIEMEGISRRALASKAQVQRKSLLNWLNAKNYPRYDALIRLADFFEVSTDYLLGLEQLKEKITRRSMCSKDKIVSQFNGKLLTYLEKEGVSKYYLSKRLKVGQTTLERWLSDRAMPDTAMLIKLAAIMEETVDYLLGRE